jgi:hypothetical protein
MPTPKIGPCAPSACAAIVCEKVCGKDIIGTRLRAQF